MKRGGFRCRWLARLTRGRLGLGRWTRDEVDQINRDAHRRWLEWKDYIE